MGKPYGYYSYTVVLNTLRCLSCGKVKEFESSESKSAPEVCPDCRGILDFLYECDFCAKQAVRKELEERNSFACLDPNCKGTMVKRQRAESRKAAGGW